MTKGGMIFGIGAAAALALVVCAAPVDSRAAERAKSTKSGKASKGKGKADKAAPTAPDIDQKTGAKLNKALELLTAEKYDQAREILEGLNRDRLSPYELARVESILAAIAQGQEKTALAREHLKKAIDSGGLNDQEVMSMRFQIAQLWLAEEKWKEGIEALKSWFASGATPNSNAYYLLAVAYYQQKDFKSALEPAQKAVDLAERPQEGWLQLLLALRLEREEYDPALPILKRLLSIAPAKKTYWMQLSNVYGMMEKYGEALVPMQMAYYAGFFSDAGEYRRLADLAINQNVPYRAAVVLTKAIDEKKIEPDVRDWEKLGNCWVAARHYDKAVAPLTRAATLAESGDIYLRIAEIHVQREEWQKAVDAVRRALDKGRLKNPTDAQMLMGVALVSQKKLKEARGYFQRAVEDSKAKGEAQGWLRFIDVELRG